jgi:Toastrack DUF4097
MRGWGGARSAVITLVLMTAAAVPVSGQSSGIVERAERAVRRAMENVADAFDRGDHDANWSRSADDFEWTGRVPNGGSLEVKGINGPIIVELASGDEARITAQTRGRRSDPSTVRIEMVEHEGGLTFCAVYPTPSRARRENWCGPGSSGQMNTERNDVQVRFVVELPEGVSFSGRTVNGGLEAIELKSDVSLVTVNGDVTVSTSGAAEATTVNGSIDASIGERALGHDLEFTTVNGSVSLDVPDDLNAALDASWLNGGLDSDLPITLEGRTHRRSIRGTLGDGGATLKISTVNGSIEIR